MARTIYEAAQELCYDTIANSLTGCWNLMRQPKKNGYILVKAEGKSWVASRLIFTVFHGEIPAGMFVCHSCDNPRCINPLHLFIGTPNDNMQDKCAKGRQPFGLEHPNSKLTEDLVREIRCKYQPRKYSTRRLASEYGMSQPTIYEIISRKIWTHIS